MRVNSAAIPDGASNSLLAGERNVNMKRAGDWTQADENNGYWDGWDWDTIRWGYALPAPDRWDDTGADMRFGSSHHGGHSALFADGSVRFLQYDIDLATFQKLCARNDGK